MPDEHDSFPVWKLSAQQEINDFREERNALRTENAKLRELVESYGIIANEAVCDYYDRDEMLADANAMASELGIEVGA